MHTVKSRKTKICTEGKILPKITDENAFAISQYGRPSIIPAENSCLPDRGDIKYMGYNLKTSKFHYTGWFNFDPIRNQPINTQQLVAEQLYDIIRNGSSDYLFWTIMHVISNDL